MACDDQYMRDKIAKFSAQGEVSTQKMSHRFPGLKVTPLWLTADMSKVTTNPVLGSSQLQSIAVILELNHLNISKVPSVRHVTFFSQIHNSA